MPRRYRNARVFATAAAWREPGGGLAARPSTARLDEALMRTLPGDTDAGLEVLSGPSSVLAFDAVGFAMDLDAIYFDVPVLRPFEAPGAGDPEAPTLID